MKFRYVCTVIIKQVIFLNEKKNQTNFNFRGADPGVFKGMLSKEGGVHCPNALRIYLFSILFFRTKGEGVSDPGSTISFIVNRDTINS
jgi:hypothetical protein